MDYSRLLGFSVDDEFSKVQRNVRKIGDVGGMGRRRRPHHSMDGAGPKAHQRKAHPGQVGCPRRNESAGDRPLRNCALWCLTHDTSQPTTLGEKAKGLGRAPSTAGAGGYSVGGEFFRACAVGSAPGFL